MQTLGELRRDGFAVIPGPVPAAGLPELASAYDAAVRDAAPEDIRHGSSTTRVNDLVNRGPEFDRLFLHPPLLEACREILAGPFKLSAMLARTLRAETPAQKLHQDFPRDAAGWTMVGFILMIDEFLPENGATRFLPGSHQWPDAEEEPSFGTDLVPACGPPGALIIYNGAAWHGHGSNVTRSPRRSIQGAFIRRDLQSSIASRLRPQTLVRIGPLARHLLPVEPNLS